MGDSSVLTPCSSTADLTILRGAYVADRENRRVQIFDLDGRYLRTIGTPFLSSPSGFARWGEFLVIAQFSSPTRPTRL